MKFPFVFRFEFDALAKRLEVLEKESCNAKYCKNPMPDLAKKLPKRKK